MSIANDRDHNIVPPRKGPTYVMRINQLEAPFALGEEERDSYLRRFSTLFVSEGGGRRGGLGCVLHATNALGEQLAVKELLLPDDDKGVDEALLRAAFRREYESHRNLATLRGFPRLFGYGTCDGTPVIVMEWVEGKTLAEARRELAVDEEGRISPLTATRLGRDLLELVSRLSLVGEGLVHRDISPANIMIRTARRSLETQRSEGSFDLCLIDFGSAEPVTSQGGSFTAASGALRHATAEYAPPEMLSDDIPAVDRLRHSPAVDVYAVGSVLCYLIGGHSPYPEAGHTVSPYRLKTEERPTRPIPAHIASDDLAGVLAQEGEVAVIVAPIALERNLSPYNEEFGQALTLVDEQIVETVMTCLSVDQRRRPTPELLRDELDGLASRYGKNVRRALGGEPLTPCMSGTPWLVMDSPFSARRLLRTGGRLLGAATWAAVVAATAWLIGKGDVARGVAVGFALGVSAPLALLARWRSSSPEAALARGTIALLGLSAASALCLRDLLGTSARLSGALAAVLVCASAAWLPMVTDYACACVPSLVRELRRQLPASTEPHPALDPKTAPRHLP